MRPIWVVKEQEARRHIFSTSRPKLCTCGCGLWLTSGPYREVDGVKNLIPVNTDKPIRVIFTYAPYGQLQCLKRRDEVIIMRKRIGGWSYSLTRVCQEGFRETCTPSLVEKFSTKRWAPFKIIAWESYNKIVKGAK